MGRGHAETNTAKTRGIIARILCKCGTPVDALDEMYGETALMLIAFEGIPEMARALLGEDCAADPTLLSLDGLTAADIAADCASGKGPLKDNETDDAYEKRREGCRMALKVLKRFESRNVASSNGEEMPLAEELSDEEACGNGEHPVHPTEENIKQLEVCGEGRI